MKEALDTVGGRAKGCVEHSTHHTRGNTLMEKNILVFLIIFQAASGAQRLKRSFELQIQTARRSFNLRIQTASDRTDLSSWKLKVFSTWKQKQKKQKQKKQKQKKKKQHTCSPCTSSTVMLHSVVEHPG